MDPSYSDLIADITVKETAQPASAPAAHADASPGKRSRTYTVQLGDTLSKISKEFYGNPNQYMKIFEANRTQLKSPNEIQVGQQLVVPE